MSKPQLLSSRAFVLFSSMLCWLLVCAPGAWARVGESQSTIEDRLKSDRIGVAYESDTVDARLKAKSRKAQHLNLIQYFPDGIEHVMYYKTSDGSSASSKDVKVRNLPLRDGWDLHVAYFKGVSVFEAYKRNGAKISEAERNALLELNMNGSTWNKVGLQSNTESGFQYDFELESKVLRAKFKDPYLLVFNTHLDNEIFRQMEIEAAEQKAEDEAQAPDSILGF